MKLPASPSTNKLTSKKVRVSLAAMCAASNALMPIHAFENQSGIHPKYGTLISA